MIISKIEESGKNFCKIYADGEFLIAIARETLKKYSLETGSEIDAALFSQISHSAQVRKARERMLYALDRRLHSEKELREKLKRDYPPDIIDEAVSELYRLELIDDKKFALAFCEHRKNVQKKGPRAVFSELILKGVDKEIISEAIAEVFSSEEEQIEGALKVLYKYRNDINTPQGKRRAYAALVRRGYSHSVISAAMREFEE